MSIHQDTRSCAWLDNTSRVGDTELFRVRFERQLKNPGSPLTKICELQAAEF